MQIVIDIPDEIVTDIKDYCGMSIADAKEALPIILNVIHNGTPLPKGHGRLKDVDWIDDNCENHYSDKDGSWCYTWKDIDNAPTIIEADKEKDE